MRNRKRVVLASLGFACAVVAATAFAATAAPGDSVPDLVGAVRGMGPISVEATVASAAFPGRSHFVDSANGDDYFIGPDSHAVEAYFSSALDRSRAYESKPDTAAIAAKADGVLDRCFVGSVDDRRSIRRTVSVIDSPADRSPNGKKFSPGYTDVMVNYQLVRGGVAYPTAASATFDGATGELLSLVQFSRPVTVSLKPTLDRNAAIGLAAERLRMPVHKVDSASLFVFAPRDGRQQLAWDVTLHTGDGGITTGVQLRILLDANGGTTVIQPRR